MAHKSRQYKIDQRNYRKHSQKNLAMIERSLAENGFIGHVVEYDDNGGQDLPVYLVEYDPEFYDSTDDALDWYDEDELEVLN